jgi:hypothetical protein
LFVLETVFVFTVSKQLTARSKFPSLTAIRKVSRVAAGLSKKREGMDVSGDSSFEAFSSSSLDGARLGGICPQLVPASPNRTRPQRSAVARAEIFMVFGMVLKCYRRLEIPWRGASRQKRGLLP